MPLAHCQRGFREGLRARKEGIYKERKRDGSSQSLFRKAAQPFIEWLKEAESDEEDEEDEDEE